MYRIPALAEIRFAAKPIMASPIVREPGFDPVSRGRTRPDIRARSYPCLCLCLGFSQITCKALRLRTTSHLSQMGLTLVRIFKVLLLASSLLPGPVSGVSPPSVTYARSHLATVYKTTRGANFLPLAACAPS
jgi:hypothetical protein